MRYIQRLIKKWSKYFNNILNYRKKAYSIYLAILIHFKSMLLDSKLLVSGLSFDSLSKKPLKDSSNKKLCIYEQEMKKKRDSLLTSEEWLDELVPETNELELLE